jgi:predicted homoserine dehydrogenase-like protein
MHFEQRQIKHLKMKPKMYDSFLDGTKCAVEMVAVSNATKLKPDVRGMHLPVGGIRDIASYSVYTIAKVVESVSEFL